ncbi:MAG: hypothetical protein ACLTE2_09145 [Eubacteriales bacterium]
MEMKIFWNFRKVSPRLVNMHFRSAAVRLFIKKMKNDGLVVSIPASVTTIKASAFSNSQCSKNIFVLEDASSFEGADKDAFSNSTWESNRPTVLFPNFSTYQNADETKKCNGKLC